MLDTDRQKHGWKEGRKEGTYQQVKGQKITLAVVQQLQKKNLKGNYFFLHTKSRVHILL